MNNYLRVLLKNMLKPNLSQDELQLQNFRVVFRPDEKSFDIYHFNFHGFEEFKVCNWSPENKSINIYEEEKCPKEEIVFIIRTLQQLRHEILEVYAIKDNKADSDNKRTSLFSNYLAKNQPV